MTERARCTILVTGAGGFVGSATASLLESAGYAVRRGVRRGSGTPCDLDRPDQVAAAIAGVDCVVHAAYGDSGRMEQQCRTLLEAMEAGNVRRLIYLSSIAVYGDAEGAVHEATPLSALDTYAAGKIACERAVKAWAEGAAGARCALILRPGIVYGQGSPFWIDKLGQRIRLGAWGTFGAAGEGLAALVHVHDVAALVVAGVEALGADAGVAHKVLNVVGPETPSWNGYFQALATALGHGVLPELDAQTLRLRQTWALPAKLWRKLGLPGMAGMALAPTPGELALFARKANYETHALAAFGFQPRIRLSDGLKRSLGQRKA